VATKDVRDAIASIEISFEHGQNTGRTATEPVTRETTFCVIEQEHV